MGGGGLCGGVSVALGPSHPSSAPGDPAWTGLHLLAVVRWSPGPHQAVPQELLVGPVGGGMERGGVRGGVRVRLSVPRCRPSVCPYRLIIGFISKQYVCKLLSTEPDGTFLLRFSDSEIGGVTIAHVIRGKDGESGRAAPRRLWDGDAVLCPRAPPIGSSQVENIQPFSAKDLSIRSLGDRIRDLRQLRNLYPNTPKDQAFGCHYNSEP